ncbi:SNF2 family N-terminal domain-containing protein [Daldinia caldariorum]|uniref:SNF2 family N-terminal domain-containing protein n=1 Tax=Daldinia caldariorum TaxID=326644 RepID=UPI002007C66A|nr:SNF2 family N-terminal domain-containing protein [Daldinia caldariorum]KAI1469732.1 SNF2 family N-terminal domain-containing protein [Daldinia caldariorum]
MAPRTRRSKVAEESSATDSASTTASQPVVPLRRGRSSKITTIDSNSAISDSGYSTPATSNPVTPAPSITSKPPQPKSRARSRLVVELPELPKDSTSTSSKSNRRISTTSSRGVTRRRPAPIAYTEEDSEDDINMEEAPREDPAPAKGKMVTSRKRPSAVIAHNSDAESDIPLSSTRVFKKPKLTDPMSDDEPDSELDDEEPIDDMSEASSTYALDEDEDEDISEPDSDDPITDSHTTVQAASQAVSQAASPTASHTASTMAARTPQRGFTFTRSRRIRRPLNRKERMRMKLTKHHPELETMWDDLESMPVLKAKKAEQPITISRQLKPFQLEGLSWMKAMELTKWKGGLLGDEMGLGKTIQAVSLIMSDYPAKAPSLVLMPPVALMQWTSEIESYTNGKLKTLVFHGTNAKAKKLTTKELKKFDVILMSYNTLESLFRKQEKGFKRKEGTYKEKSAIHQIKFHRVILDEAHCIKSRNTMTAKACFALKVEYRWCLTGTPLQNRIGEFFSLLRFLKITPFAEYFCRECSCANLEWSADEHKNCKDCGHYMMLHVSVFNQELLHPISRSGNRGEGKEALAKLRLLTDRIMLRRLKKDHTNAMELPVKEVYVDRQFLSEEENDFAKSITDNSQRKFDTYVAQGVLLNNYANIFGLIMQMRQVANHPDLILKKNAQGGQNILVCCICDEPAEEAIRSKCKHDFCRSCAQHYVNSQGAPDCPRCHIPLSIDLEQPEIEQDAILVKKSSIINRIKMENWTSSSKIELLVHELHRLRSDSASHKSIIFSQFTTMLQLIEWRLRRAGITTVMLDGSMTPAQRQASIDHFMKNVDVECFLVSLKAGGVALNLTEASRVFIVDPWWNPAAEWQSADRCHRIGQTRPCIIKRLCIEDSVESRIVALQEKKANMIRSTVNSDEASLEALTHEDLQFLFKGS